jgi:hypothetical protein
MTKHLEFMQGSEPLGEAGGAWHHGDKFPVALALESHRPLESYQDHFPAG